MTITLNISPEAEAALSRSASLAGKPLPEFAAELLEDAAVHPALPLEPWQLALQTPSSLQILSKTPAERIAFYDRMIADSPGGPSLPDEAFDRENLYD